MSIVKKMIHVLVKPLTHILNLSLSNGIFPDKMKIAKVIPIIKSGSEEEQCKINKMSLLNRKN